MKFLAKNEQGVGIVAVVVAMAVLAIVIKGSSSMMSLTKKNETMIKSMVEYVEMRDILNGNVECALTDSLKGTACLSNAKIDIYSKRVGNPVLVKKVVSSPLKASYTSIGKYTLRASYAACPICTGGKKVLIEYSRMSKNGDLKRHPVTKKQGEWKDLYDGVPFKCPLKI